MKIRSYYEDTDAGGIVYHTNYIKYCERARSEIFFEKGATPTDGENSGFVVKHIDANFLGMATLGELIEVQTEVVKQRSASLVLKQTIFKEQTKIFEMHITLVFVREGRPKAIPKELRQLFG
jgi:acyl-CoA thioester hydrolase